MPAVPAPWSDASTFAVAGLLAPSALPAGLAIRAGTVVKEPENPLLVQDQPWEHRLDNSYPNIVHRPGDPLGNWRLWYSNHAPIANFLTANSPDGLTWYKPKLGLFNLTGLHGCKLSPELCSIGTAKKL